MKDGVLGASVVARDNSPSSWGVQTGESGVLAILSYIELEASQTSPKTPAPMPLQHTQKRDYFSHGSES